MLYSVVSIVYAVVNLGIAILIYAKYSRALVSKFYFFCVACMCLLGVLTSIPGQIFGSFMPYVEHLVVFLYATLPFFFIHFLAIFVEHADILKSRAVIVSIYIVALFSYTMILLGYIPRPITIGTEITFAGRIFYITWMSVLFALGIAMLYEVARGFYERAGKAKILLVCFIVLLLFLPSPFSESVFFKILKVDAEWYFLSSTMSLAVATYFIFRHKIIVSSLYGALKAALSAVNDLFLTTNKDLKIEMVHGVGASTLLGYSEKDLLDKSFLDIIESPKEVQASRDKIVAGTLLEFYIDMNVKSKRGEDIPMNFSIAPMMIHGDVVGFVCVGRDLTNRIKLEDELRQSQKLEGLGTLAAGIAHDFNNLLQIFALNNAKLKSMGVHDKVLQEISHFNTQAIERASSLVGQILLFARKTEMKRESVDVNSLIRDLTKMIGGTFPKTIEITTALSSTHLTVLADRGNIFQVLLNLCINARDAMAQGGILTLESEVVSGKPEGENSEPAGSENFARIRVSDTGHGMDKETRTRIFDPFFTTKAPGQGTGLGLSVVHSIIQRHNGSIEVKSSKGVGTTFEIFLPIAEEVVTSPAHLPAGTQSTHKGPATILFVEDEELIITNLVPSLTEAGYNVLIARDGLEAIEIFEQKKNEIKTVVTDIGLPFMNGWDAFLRMRELKPDVRVIVTTGYLDVDAKTQKFGDGASDFILKPYEAHDLLLSIEKVLSGTNNS